MTVAAAGSQPATDDHRMTNDPTTNQLRDDDWHPRPGVMYACGCRAGRLCPLHRVVRATEDHHPAAPPQWVENAWTCPDCGRSYWSPREWEPELWRMVAEYAKRIHARRHTQERIEARDAGRERGP